MQRGKIYDTCATNGLTFWHGAAVKVFGVSDISGVKVLSSRTNKLWTVVTVNINRQEAQLSPSDRAMRLVSSNLANYHATVHKILIQVLTKPMV